ncbi:MAG: sulfite exporter TauE/SafE family protein [Rhodospirillales bacterium]|nr:sulfite exporter TauE/SafE family protein [Rhodospirillales bacterium]
MITEPFFYFVAIPAVLIVGVSKGGFGGGFGILATPLMAMAVGPTDAAAIMLPILCVMDLFGLWAYRGKWDRANMRILIVASFGGIAIGTASFRYLDANAIRLLLGVIAVGFSLNYWLRRSAEPPPPRGPSVLRGGFWGCVSGFTSFVAHAGGPPLSVYLLPQRLEKTVYQATTVIFFTWVNYVKLVPYTWLGQFNGRNLATALVLMPLAPLGIWLGVYLHRAVSARVFYNLCYVFVFGTGLKLLYDGIAASFG